MFLQDKLKLFMMQLIELYSTFCKLFNGGLILILFKFIGNKGIFLFVEISCIEGGGLTPLSKLRGDFKKNFLGFSDGTFALFNKDNDNNLLK